MLITLAPADAHPSGARRLNQLGLSRSPETRGPQTYSWLSAADQSEKKKSREKRKRVETKAQKSGDKRVSKADQRTVVFVVFSFQQILAGSNSAEAAEAVPPSEATLSTSPLLTVSVV